MVLLLDNTESNRQKRMRLIGISILLMFLSTFALQNKGKTVFLNESKKQLLIPLKSITTEYTDNTSESRSADFSDQFYADISDKLVMNELSKKFNSIELLTDTTEINKLYSLIDSSTNNNTAAATDSLQSFIKRITDFYKADFIVLPDFCLLKYKTVHQKNWRDGRSGSSYERPVSITATAEYHVKFYSTNGKVERESIGKGKNGQPLLYSILKKRKFEKDVVTNSRKRYAPPLVKAMYKAIVASIKIL